MDGHNSSSQSHLQNLSSAATCEATGSSGLKLPQPSRAWHPPRPQPDAATRFTRAVTKAQNTCLHQGVHDLEKPKQPATQKGNSSSSPQ